MNNNKPVYLAAPYSHESASVREDRARRVRRAHARLILAGYVVYSPICQSHAMATDPDVRLPIDWEFWQRSCRVFLGLCGSVVVLKLDGWIKSVGVTNEIRIAKSLGIGVMEVTEDEVLNLGRILHDAS